MKKAFFRAACMLMLMILPFSFAQSESRYTLITATDLHFIAPSLTDHGAYFTAMIESADGKMTHYSDELTDAFIAQVISQSPDALLLTGDLTFNGARKSHEDLAAKLQRIADAGIPVFVMPGNHDINSKIAASFSGAGYSMAPSVSASEFESIYRDFGFSAAIARDPGSLSYIVQLRPGLRLLMLDVNTPETPGAIRQSTLAWLWDEMGKAQRAGDKVIAASHQNLYAHSSLLSQGFIIANAQSLQSLYAQCGVLLNLSGHIHMQHTVQGDGLVPEVATSSLSVSPCQYGVVTLQGDTGSYHTETVDVAGWAAEIGTDDPNLLNFPAYADAFFKAISLKQAASMTAGQPDAVELADCLAQINASYFAGRLDQLSPDPRLVAFWSGMGSFLGQYIDSILEEGPVDHTRFTFPL